MKPIGNSALYLIKFFEGFESKAYFCPANVLTIGFGHTKTVTEGQEITVARASELLKQDIIEAQDGVRALVKANINIFQFDALTSFVYNLGFGNFENSTLLKLINANPNDPLISDEFMRWVYAGGKKLKGLEMRRKKEAEIYFKTTP